jgi:hypothetical protein
MVDVALRVGDALAAVAKVAAAVGATSEGVAEDVAAAAEALAAVARPTLTSGHGGLEAAWRPAHFNIGDGVEVDAPAEASLTAAEEKVVAAARVPAAALPTAVEATDGGPVVELQGCHGGVQHDDPPSRGHWQVCI